MRKLMILGIAIVAVAAFAPRDSMAICTGYAETGAIDDNHLPVTSGPYDPCFSWLTWTYIFDRLNTPISNTIIAFEVLGAPGSRREYADWRYSPRNYEFSETQWVGPSTYNEIQITKVSGPDGSFGVLVARAKYTNGSPTAPGPNGE